MAQEYRHKRYFRIRLADSSLVTFSSTSDANTKISFKSEWTTNSPTTTDALEDSGQTLVKTFEFDSDSDQTGFKSTIDAIWADGVSPWNGDDSTQTVEHFKTEWIDEDGASVGETINL